MQSKAAILAALVSLLSAANLQPVAAQWTQAQATWYDGIFAGYCGYFDNIPQNQFVAAWPHIEDGPAGSGQDHWQPGLSGNACGQCVEVRCHPGFVENSVGSIYIDRSGDCRDENLGVVVKVVDECRCSGADLQLSDRGNFNWCCNQPTPKLGIDRHIDLSRAAFTQLIRDGDYGRGVMNINFRPASCDYIGLTRIQSDGSSIPLSGGTVISTSTPAAYSIQGSSVPPPAVNSDNAAPTPPSPQGPPSPPPASPSDNSKSDSNQDQGNQGSSPASPPSSDSTPNPSPSSPPPADSSLSASAQQSSSSSKPNNGVSSPLASQSHPQSPSPETPPPSVSPSSSADGSSSSTTTTTSSSSSDSTSSGSSVVQQSAEPQAPAIAEPADVGGGEAAKAGVSATELSHYAQCGGNCRSAGGSTACDDLPFPGYKCDEKLVCVRQNRWYWQCLTQNEADDLKVHPSNWQTGVPQKPDGCNTLLYTYAQCGGLAGSCKGPACVDAQAPGTCCESGSYCKRFDAYYWECRPEGLN